MVEPTTSTKDFEVHPGGGVSALVNEKLVLVGNKKLMHKFHVPINPDVESYIQEYERKAQTTVLVSINGILSGAFTVADPPKPEARLVISYLKSINIPCIMVTGDNLATASAIAEHVGISSVFAETSPFGKSEKIKELQVTNQR